MEAPALIRRGIAIGMASNGRGVPIEWAISLATQAWPLNVTLHYIRAVGMEVGEARNGIVREALARKTRYVWFIDDDVVVPTNACRKLVDELERHPEAVAVGGIYAEKADPTAPVVFKDVGDGAFWAWKPGEVFGCAAIGTGCLLVRTSVFERLPEPWFKTVSEPEPDGGPGRLTMTDDTYFCQLVREAGHVILAHGGVLCDHYAVQDDGPPTIFTVPLDRLIP